MDRALGPTVWAIAEGYITTVMDFVTDPSVPPQLMATASATLPGRGG